MHWHHPPAVPYRAASGLGESTGLLRDRARTLYAEGQDAFDAGRYLDALDAFQAAYRTLSNPVVLVAMGSALERIGRVAEAREKWRDYLRRDPTGPAAALARERLAATAPPEVPVAPSVPREAKEGPPAPAELPVPPEAYGSARGSTVGVWVVTGAGVVALAALGWWLSRPKKPKANRRRR